MDEDSPSMHFPGTRSVVAQKDLEPLESNLETFKKIFEDLHISRCDYRASFDDLIRGRLEYLFSQCFHSF